MQVTYVTPHTYQVKEISYLEWCAALIVYQQANK